MSHRRKQTIHRHSVCAAPVLKQGEAEGSSLSRPTRIIPFMMVCMMSTACSSVSRLIFQSKKHWLPGMRTGEIVKEALVFRKELGNGLVAKG